MGFCSRAIIGMLFLLFCIFQHVTATRRADDQYFSGKVVVEGEGRISSLRFGDDESLRLYKKIIGDLDTLKLEGAMHLQGYYLRLDTGPDCDAFLYETGIDVPFAENTTFEFFNSNGGNITLLVNGQKVVTEQTIIDLVNKGCVSSDDICTDTVIQIQNGGTGGTTPEQARENLGIRTLSTKECVANEDLCNSLVVPIENGGTGATNATAARDNLGLGDLATKDKVNDFDWEGEPLSIKNGGTGARTPEEARENLELGLLSTKDYLVIDDIDFGTCPLSIENGGTGARTDGEARTNLGLGRIATLDCVEYMDLCCAIPIEMGGTGASNEGDARVNLGLGRVSVLDCVADTDFCGVVSIEHGGTGASTQEEARINLGLGELSTLNGISNTNWIGMPLMISNGGTGGSTAAEARINLGLGKLAVLDGVSGSNWVGMPLMIENGGTGASTAEEARTNLGLGRLATLDGISNTNWIGMPLSIINGGTGASTSEEARLNLGLGGLAVLDGISDENWIGTPLSIENGGTGASSAEEARLNLGLGDLATKDNVAVSDLTGDLCFERDSPFDFAMKIENSHIPSNFEEEGYDRVSGLLINLAYVTEPTRQNEFVRFVGEGTTFGAIRGSSRSGNSGGIEAGIEFTSISRDFAEWLPRFNIDEKIVAGDIVGVTPCGKVTKRLDDVQYIQVVSTAPIVLGNAQQKNEADYEKVAMLGQVPVKVHGRVELGDCILPSGLHDGHGVAKPCSQVLTSELSTVIGTAWESVESGGKVNVAIGLLDSRLVAEKTASLDNKVENLVEENQALKEKMRALEDKLDYLLQTIISSQ